MKKYVKFSVIMMLALSMMMLMTACSFSLFGPRSAADVMKNYEKQTQKNQLHPEKKQLKVIVQNER